MRRLRDKLLGTTPWAFVPPLVEGPRKGGRNAPDDTMVRPAPPPAFKNSGGCRVIAKPRTKRNKRRSMENP
jgi:hypothetical protein